MKAKHQNNAVDYDIAYEPNVIGLRGIVGFGIGLLILILVTFALMWALLAVMHDQAAESKGPASPLEMTDTERLPPEPRLQSAPGFGVESENGKINLELQAPQSEYRVLQQQWSEMWTKGMIDPKTGSQITMPVEKGKELLLQRPILVKPGSDPELLERSRLYVTDQSAGRLASEKHR